MIYFAFCGKQLLPGAHTGLVKMMEHLRVCNAADCKNTHANYDCQHALVRFGYFTSGARRWPSNDSFPDYKHTSDNDSNTRNKGGVEVNHVEQISNS